MRLPNARTWMMMGALLLTPAAAAAQDPPAPSMDPFFDDSVVQEIRLTIHSSDWTLLKEKFLENIYYPCRFEWQGQTVQNVGIRSRGLGSRSSVKPGLRVDFDRFAPDQTFLGMKSFVLDNLVQDPSMLKERLAMALFRRLGLPAPRETHARLFVNNEFVGLYAVVEALDKGFLGRAFGADALGGVENDGYLYEYDYTREYRFEYLGANLDEYRLFDPKTNESHAAAQIWGPVEDMIQAINELPDATFARDVAAFLDLGLFARHLAIESFLAENDGILGYAGLNNFYLYRFENTTRFQFLPWDKDNTFESRDFSIWRNVDTNVLARRALNVPDARNRFLDTLLEAAASVDERPADPAGAPVEGPGWLEREMTRQYEQIRAAAYNDTLKPFPNQAFDEAYARLLDFARNRSAAVRAEVSAAGR